MMRDADDGRIWTDRELRKLEWRIRRVFREASDELSSDIKDYFNQFVQRDAEMQAMCDAGKITLSEYQKWRLNQIGRGERFIALRDKIAKRMVKAQLTTYLYINDSTPGIYSMNRNYIAYTIERMTGADFTLWNERAVKRLLLKQPDLMPYYPQKMALDRGIALNYGKKQITRSVQSGILQGKSIPKIADDLQKRIPAMTRDSAIRAARTATTNAENAGRQDSFVAAQKMGIDVRKRWIATKDMRTRHEHGMADGQIVPASSPFIVGGEELMFPGDKNGSPWNVYNCRCAMRTVEKEGIEAEPRKIRVRDPVTGKNVVVSDMTYSEWLVWKEQREKEAKGGKR